MPVEGVLELLPAGGVASVEPGAPEGAVPEGVVPEGVVPEGAGVVSEGVDGELAGGVADGDCVPGVTLVSLEGSGAWSVSLRLQPARASVPSNTAAERCRGRRVFIDISN